LIVAALDEQLQALQQAANSASEVVNVRGTLLVDGLQDIPNRVREVATHGVRQGIATTLALAQLHTGRELHHLQPIFPEGAELADYDELVDDFEGIAETIDNETDADGIVNKVFFMTINLF
jgi:hypothetical protein